MTEEEESLQQTSKKPGMLEHFHDAQDLPGAGGVSLVLRGGVPAAAALVKRCVCFRELARAQDGEN